MGKPLALGSHDRTGGDDEGSKFTRPIVAKFTIWKQKENVLRVARQKKLIGIKLVPDFAKRTLDRRAEKIPELIKQRKMGKIAYLVMDKIVVTDKPPDRRHDSSLVLH